MIIEDDRNEEQKKTHNWLVIGTDRGMSGWGKASGGKSYAVWACKPDFRDAVLNWVESRSDMARVRETFDGETKYRPSGSGHCHIYVVTEEHPAIPTNHKEAYAAA